MVASSSKPLSLADGEIHVWTARFIDDDSTTNDLIRLLDHDERVRAERLVQPRDRARFIQFHAFTRQIVGGYLGVPPRDATFARGPHGKPQAASGSGYPGFHFNLSHSGDYCMLAARIGCPVGIDIEALRDGPQALAIAARRFARSEAALIGRLDGDARRDAFFALWTHKEAAVKCLGQGLAANLARFTFALDAMGCPQLAAVARRRSHSPHLWLRPLAAPDGYAAALASLRPCRKIDLRTWKAGDGTPSADRKAPLWRFGRDGMTAGRPALLRPHSNPPNRTGAAAPSLTSAGRVAVSTIASCRL